MATPVIRINNPGAPKDRQQAVVMATKEARLYREKKMVFPRPPQELLNPATALSHAERLLRAEGIPTPSRQQCLGKLVLPFGQYENAPFRWLVENDVGYIKFMLDKHRTEVTNTHRKGPVGNQWVKDHLTEYAESFPEVSALLEANIIDRCVYGQKGFEHHTFREMWELYSQYRTQKDRPEQFSAEQRETIQKAYSSVRRWQNTPVTHILSVQMKRFKKYIRDNEEQLQASTSQSDASSWPGDDAELVAASQAVEDLLKTQESPSGARQEQAEKAVKPQKKAKAADPLPKQPETAVQLLKQAQLQKERQLLKQAQQQKQPETADPLPKQSQQRKQPETTVQLLKQSQQQKQPETADPLPKQAQQQKQPETADPLPKQSQQQKQPEAAVQLPKQSQQQKERQQQKQPEADVQQSPSTSSGHDTGSPLSDSSVELEGWVRLWENPNGIPLADISWLKEDTERGLFTPVQLYKDFTGLLKRRRVMKSDRMWFYPPEPPGYVSGGLPTPQLFFRSRVFVWRPVGVWRYSLKCPRGDGCAGTGRNVHLCESGYHTRVRHICDVSSWYTVVTEVLCCGPCTKAARSKEGGTVGRWLAWDQAILSQLSEAHQAMFPAILTSKRGVDKNVVRLLRDRTEGNTMVKVWRQVQESHVEDYLHRKDLYTTILMTVAQPGGIVSAFRQTFQAPPPQRELPSARLLRHAFLLAEANNVQDYRNQILSTFGTVLKMDSTKKVVKKLSGEGHGSAEWFTSIGNEYSQIVSFVLTCEESTQKLEPMCRGVMDRFRLANQPVPKILYVDKGCCPAQGPTAVETLFQPWVDNGMVVRLDIFHWIHRFDAAIRTESHCKYAVFKSAVAGAVLGYNREDLELLIKAVRAQDPATMKSLSDEDVVRCYISREQLKHHVRRVTLGAQETFRLIHLAIEELKGPAGLDESGVSLFKTPEAIDEMWAAQQQHLECIQDPPDMSMYRVARTTTINKVDVPFYKAMRGSKSLEGFHKSLPHMIPGPHCAARPYQVYLISGIARWNSDRSSDAVFGGKGRHHRTYSAPLIDRLNARCQQLFGETVEDNFRAPADVASNELLGLEYLFNQSTGQSGTFSLQDIVNDGPDPEKEVVQHGQPDPDAIEAYESDAEACDNALDADLPHIKLTNDETSTVHPPAFEDACSQNPLPGFQKLENFCSVLVEIGVAEDKLSLSTEQRNKVLDAWNAVEDHDKQQQQFNQLYRTHWGNTLYCRTKRDDLVDAAVIQRLKMAKRYAPAQQDISAQHNRLMYTLVKLLWLRSPQKSHASPEKATILKAYERIQHRILVEDPVLCKAGIPLPKINIKTVRDFIRSQERLLNLRATPQPTTLITKITSVSSAPIPPAPHQPAVLAPPDYPLMQYVPTPSTAGTKVLKARTDTIMPVSRPQPPLPPVLLPPPVRKTPATSTITRPVPSVSATTAMAGIAGTSTQPITPADQTTSHPQTLLPTPPLPLTSAGPSTSAAAAAPPAATSSWSRSTKYKRKLKEQLSGISEKVPRVQTLPVCSTCGQLTQGHKKYKKKSYCPVKRMSSSKGLDKRVYDSYEHFASVVDALVQ